MGLRGVGSALNSLGQLRVDLQANGLLFRGACASDIAPGRSQDEPATSQMAVGAFLAGTGIYSADSDDARWRGRWTG
jgi:hypothetical protein